MLACDVFVGATALTVSISALVSGGIVSPAIRTNGSPKGERLTLQRAAESIAASAIFKRIMACLRLTMIGCSKARVIYVGYVESISAARAVIFMSTMTIAPVR